MTNETYLVGGVGRNKDGKLKARYSTLSVADTLSRQERAGNTDLLYVDLPKAMTRDEIPAYLLTLEAFTSNPAFRACLEAANTNHALKSKTPRFAKNNQAPAKPKAKKAAPKVAAPKTPKLPKPAKTEDEDLIIEELKALAA